MVLTNSYYNDYACQKNNSSTMNLIPSDIEKILRKATSWELIGSWPQGIEYQWLDLQTKYSCKWTSFYEFKASSPTGWSRESKKASRVKTGEEASSSPRRPCALSSPTKPRLDWLTARRLSADTINCRSNSNTWILRYCCCLLQVYRRWPTSSDGGATNSDEKK